MALGIAEALAHLHSLQPALVFVALSGQRIVVAADWTAKLADFRWCWAEGEHFVRPDGDPHFCGPPRGTFPAPELLEDGPASPAHDVFALGYIMWQLLSWETPQRHIYQAEDGLLGGKACLDAATQPHRRILPPACLPARLPALAACCLLPAAPLSSMHQACCVASSIAGGQTVITGKHAQQRAALFCRLLQAMLEVLDGRRPRIPTPREVPGNDTQQFGSLQDFITLMESCWAQDPAHPPQPPMWLATSGSWCRPSLLAWAWPAQ
ncbi:hypothetical protein ABPG75_013665 [Micractinium tetrahymenae]